LEIQTIPPRGHSALNTANGTILVETIPCVAEAFKTVINKLTNGTDFKLLNLLNPENEDLTNEDPITRIDVLENRWNNHLVSNDTLTSTAKHSSNGRLSHCLWRFGIFDDSDRYKTKSSVGW
jgi:hypothetical protein